MFIFSFIKKHKIAFSIAGVALVGLFVSSLFFGSPNEITENTKKDRTVDVVSIRDLISGKGALEIFGTVVSVSQAEVRAETPGEVVGVYHDIGDRVSAGTIIGELKNTSQRAALLQAQAGLKSAQSRLALAKANSDTSVTSFTNSIQNSYATAEDAIRNKVDTFFVSDNPEDNIKRILDLFDDTSLRVEINAERKKVETILDDWRISVQNLTENSDTEIYFSEAKNNLQKIQGFLNNVVVAVNLFEASPVYSEGSIATFKANATAARSAVSGSLSSLIASESALARGESSAANQNTLIAEAGVKQAEAGVLVAQDSFEKTIFRAPISGEINELSIERGSFIAAFAPVAIVANNQALQIEGFITEGDRARITVGSEALVSGRYKGVVTRIAPALDSQTKKIKIIVALTDNAPSTLTNGQSVEVKISAITPAKETENAQEIILPLSALKVETNRTVVFTVENNTLIAHPVVTGSILGQDIVIKEGISLDMVIVRDARGLQDGDTVNTQ